MPNQRPIQHHIMFSDLDAYAPGACFEIIGQEAHHAWRVKRIALNEPVGVLDGCGRIGTGIVVESAGSKSKPRIRIELKTVRQFPPISPRIELYGALPKGDRLERMIDQLSQLGVSSFRPLLCDRSVRRFETVRIDKLERIAIESAKQCHRPWILEINPPIRFEDAVVDPDALVADRSGTAEPISTPGQRTIILIGPEGGWSDAERALMGATEARVVRFGLFVLRIELAACVASAIVLSKAFEPQGETP